MKIVVGGALNKKENAELIEKYGNGQVEVVIMQDIQAALALKNGQADYYFGSCQTGAGGALGMAIAILLQAFATNVWQLFILRAIMGLTSGYIPNAILKSIENGKKAFGFVPEAAASVIPVIMRGIMG